MFHAFALLLPSIKSVLAILAESLAEVEKGVHMAPIGVHLPPYKVKMRFLRSLDAVWETQIPA